MRERNRNAGCVKERAEGRPTTVVVVTTPPIVVAVQRTRGTIAQRFQHVETAVTLALRTNATRAVSPLASSYPVNEPKGIAIGKGKLLQPVTAGAPAGHLGSRGLCGQGADAFRKKLEGKDMRKYLFGAPLVVVSLAMTLLFAHLPAFAQAAK